MSTPVRLLRRLALAAALTAAGVQPALATAPVLTEQAPGFHRMQVGDYVVTALYDGYVDLDPKILKGASAQDIQTLLASMFAYRASGMQTAVNGYLVHTGKQLVLVDTGAGACFGPTLGRLDANLRAAGYRADQVDLVLLTHLHPDHACGLLDAQGGKLFPNADVYAARAEADFWLSAAAAAQAPADAQPFFKMARDAVAPYQVEGRFLTYANGDALPAGIQVVPSPGHTPGHTSYLFESSQHSLLVWGDIVHNHAVQLARPEIAIEFDVDGAQAVTTRKKIFADAARDRLWVAGAHMPFPGLGHVNVDGQGYAWVPAEYGPLRTPPRP
ncbi:MULTISPECIES: MBL fold metallo-hydrolase [Bordetella]|uniref:Metallo-beta-lactamase superfamily protein n=4 Tax=Bordetella TaxID=517 RepID=K0MNZ9_BORPB|nr:MULTISPECIES: MBL fold metallo-hydrolase [Bordetella]KAK58998.1 metallo-beta-lactamase domain protein [Bordetella bronchiseptica 980-2]SHP65728.1 beta-lactamase-like protein [Mycobacteroides abscessus subsp. abscessus]AUV50022.1 MBL fold metallo-hydrolase [Bordetella bronchiseptica]AWP77115.1 MBL fold metallo-hydrolase [Bordetella bronchiseptica]AWP81969.1 MBL fold metallo-hydrolase [Bordetella bronchiseptica]